jgi:hypothetical protein
MKCSANTGAKSISYPHPFSCDGKCLLREISVMGSIFYAFFTQLLRQTRKRPRAFAQFLSEISKRHQKETGGGGQLRILAEERPLLAFERSRCLNLSATGLIRCLNGRPRRAAFVARRVSRKPRQCKPVVEPKQVIGCKISTHPPTTLTTHTCPPQSPPGSSLRHGFPAEPTRFCRRSQSHWRREIESLLWSRPSVRWRGI